MAIAHAWSVALVGVQGHVVKIEADVSRGLPGLSLIGLPDASLNEARDRVRAAVHNSSLAWPRGRMTVGLSPATLPKAGSSYDLAIAASLLAAAGELSGAALAGRVLLGELGLDGSVRAVPGVLPAVLAAATAAFTTVIVPAGNATEAALVPGVTVQPVASLRELVAVLSGQPPVTPVGTPVPPPSEPMLDLADVLGQPEGRFAMEVAAAGGHHSFLVGPPGAGKTMLAERLAPLFPALDSPAALEVSAVHSVAGLLAPYAPLITRPPFRRPHHNISMAALIGGGGRMIRPGEVSCAHRGVLFLDEAPEFAAGLLDALRQPLESGVVEIVRARGSAQFPARCVLVLAANPCPCAAASGRRADCTCTSTRRRQYLGRLSGPLLDRVDVRVQVAAVSRVQMVLDGANAESTAVVGRRVGAARRAAKDRFAGTSWQTNAEVPGPELRRRWPLPRRALRLADHLLESGTLSARGYDRILRVAWTLGDLAGVTVPGPEQVDTALALRLPGVVAA